MSKLFIYHLSKRTPVLCERWKRRFKGMLLNEMSYPLFDAGDVVINYGCSKDPLWSSLAKQKGAKILNHWNVIRRTSNKLLSLRDLASAGIRAIEWTTEPDIAASWDRIVVRHKVKGTRGEGIEVIDKGDFDTVPEAPLYTKYFRKSHEFRVHVFDGKVIDYTQKKRLTTGKVEERGVERNKYVRSHANGWVFCRDDIMYHGDIAKLALKATTALGLNFAGVDILANFDKETSTFKDAVVCELNSAPGMVKTTYQRYCKAIKETLTA